MSKAKDDGINRTGKDKSEPRDGKATNGTPSTDGSPSTNGSPPTDPDSPARRGRGRPPRIHAPGDQPDSPARRGRPPRNTMSLTEISEMPEDTRIRVNGTPVPLVVQKIWSHIVTSGITVNSVQDPGKGGLGRSALYHYRVKSGQPKTQDVVRLAKYLDISLDYLIDDDAPVEVPAPKNWEKTSYGMLDSARAMGISIEDVERYMMVIRLAVELQIEPARAIKMLATGAVDRRDFLDGGSGLAAGGPRGGSGGGSGDPKFHSPTNPTVDERNAADDAARRRNGGPRPRIG